ncbi:MULTISPECIES: DUF6233 domain-containing protein [unclassified Streptomyces]|uniref:DUF6233 domain-containing protein n=1 Tax=unclassified Streptomyces TaxID=2593676 RepID=UPI00386E733C
MICRAASTCLSGCGERVRPAAAAAGEQRGQGRGDPRAAPVPLRPPKRRPSAADAESSDPPSSGFVVERRDRGDATKGAIIHTTDCSWSPHNARPVEVRLARDALAKDARFFEACSFCRPDNALGFLE